MGARKSETSFRKKTKALISLAYYVAELLGKSTIDKKSSGETRGRQGSSSRNYDVLGREIFTPDEVRKLDNKKCIIFIRGFDPILDNKYIPFAHPMFDQTADGKGEPYVHDAKASVNLIGPPFEILTAKAVAHFEKMKEKGENIYIDDLKYEEFMLLGEVELNRRFTSLEEKVQKDKLNEEQGNELEYAEDMVANQRVQPKPKAKRKEPEWEDKISNRIVHWEYTKEQIQEMHRALDSKVQKALIMQYFYPDVTVEQMRKAWEN